MISVQTVTAMAASNPPLADALRFEYLPDKHEDEQARRLPALRHHSPSSELSPGDFRVYNRIAELMELYRSGPGNLETWTECLPRVHPPNLTSYGKKTIMSYAKAYGSPSADKISYQHQNFRHTFRTFYAAVNSSPPSSNALSGPSIRQIVALGTTFLHNLREHEATEDRHLFPLLSTRMPAFYDAAYSSTPSSARPAAPAAFSALHTSPPPTSTSWPPSIGQQHRHLHDHAHRIEKYLHECREGKRELLRDELTAELNSFGGVLFSHLDEEVRELGAEKMRLYWSLEEVKKMQL